MGRVIKINQRKYPFTLSELPYAMNGLEPTISSNTLAFHHGKHHQTYVTNLNNLLQGKLLASLSLEEIIKKTAGDLTETGTFNNAAQVWNHDFFWHSMCPSGGGEPEGALLKQIEGDFGSYANFRSEFTKSAVSQFGSGWVWLVWDCNQEHLFIIKTGNAETPMREGYIALMTIDVWEHAYYLDYQNRRVEYVNDFMDKLINWAFAEENFSSTSNAR